MFWLYLLKFSNMSRSLYQEMHEVKYFKDILQNPEKRYYMVKIMCANAAKYNNKQTNIMRSMLEHKEYSDIIVLNVIADLSKMSGNISIDDYSQIWIDNIMHCYDDKIVDRKINLTQIVDEYFVRNPEN